MRALLLLPAALALASCARPLSPADQHKLDVFECRVHAVLPIAGEVFDAQSLVRDIIAGKADLSAIAKDLGAAEVELHEVLAAWSACDPQPAITVPADAPGKAL